MPGRQAKAITPAMLRAMLIHTRWSSLATRDAVVILLSAKAGLHACEIAKLRWTDVMDATGRIGHMVVVSDAIAKKGGGRRIPMHRQLRTALLKLQQTDDPKDPIIRSRRGGAMQPNSIVNWFVVLFAELGLEGCSSHSGRRSFITTAARKLHLAGCSLRDVQLLAGHRSITTTQHYIDGHTEGQRKLISMI